MRIGLTYNLKSRYLKLGYTKESVAEFDREDTIDALAGAIDKVGHEVTRIGCLEELLPRLLAGERWDLVFNIAEGLHGISREAQLPALLDAYGIPHVFSDTHVLALALDKGLTDAVMRGCGIPTPEFQIIRTPDDLKNFHMPYPVFAKPVAEGTSRGITAKSVVHNDAELHAEVASLLHDYQQPALLETYLSGREFTVGLLGNGVDAEVLGVMEVKLYGKAEREAYTYENKQLYEDRVSYCLVDDQPEVAAIAKRAWAVLPGLDAGRVDVRIDAAGKPRFMEVNPLAGLNPELSDLCILCRLKGMPYQTLIEGILNSALRRVKNAAK